MVRADKKCWKSVSAIPKSVSAVFALTENGRNLLARWARWQKLAKICQRSVRADRKRAKSVGAVFALTKNAMILTEISRLKTKPSRRKRKIIPVLAKRTGDKQKLMYDKLPLVCSNRWQCRTNSTQPFKQRFSFNTVINWFSSTNKQVTANVSGTGVGRRRRVVVRNYITNWSWNTSSICWWGPYF